MTYYVNRNKPQAGITASPSKYPQKYFKEKPCKHCNTGFQPLAPSHLYCSQECTDTAHTINYLEKTYGITLEQYKDLKESQNDRCAICNEEGFILNPNSKSKLVVDHCHTTGKVRGFLCHNCNRALGLFQDSVAFLEKAIKYLKKDYPKLDKQGNLV